LLGLGIIHHRLPERGVHSRGQVGQPGDVHAAGRRHRQVRLARLKIQPIFFEPFETETSRHVIAPGHRPAVAGLRQTSPPGTMT
ncbi:MAG: hypothetical protein AB7O66_13270, partial [Limisphaerales bacterium]